MLVWSKSGRLLVWGVAVPLFLIVYGLPIAVIALASVSGQWNDILPTKLTLVHYANAFRGDSSDSLKTSIATGAIASVAALVSGTWAALALRKLNPLRKRILDLIFFIPSAVPSVSIGLGLLVAFSQPPLLLNGTRLIVLTSFGQSFRPQELAAAGIEAYLVKPVKQSRLYDCMASAIGRAVATVSTS